MIQPVYIQSIAALLPGPRITNDRIEEVMGRIGEQRSRARAIVLRSNRIKSRHYCFDSESREWSYTGASLAAACGREAVTKAGLTLDQVAFLCCATTTPDQVLPPHAAMVQGELGIPRTAIGTVHGVCSSSAGAFDWGYLQVGCGRYPNALVIASERASQGLRREHYEFGPRFKAFLAEVCGQLGREVSPEEIDAVLAARQRPLAFDEDFLRWMLSDGAGAVVLGTAPRPGALEVVHVEMESRAGELPPCMTGGVEWSDNVVDAAISGGLNLRQDIDLLNQHIVPVTIDCVRHCFASAGLDPAEVDVVIPHLSSEYFIDGTIAHLAAVGLELPRERWFTNLTRVGNVGTASIWIALEEAIRTGTIGPGQTVLLVVPESSRFNTVCVVLRMVE
ncbi:MAG: 3-oxoacyl-[acyl-carrier-protein] synthase III C-terminal domain-containing protein [Nitrospirota bacterium]